MPEEVIRLLERSGRRPRSFCAPTGRAMVKLDVREGAQSPAAPLFEIASLDPVWLVVDYPQTQAQSLAVGNRGCNLRKLVGAVPRHGRRIAAADEAVREP
ncbi:MAG: efflux RND transporter periplasmic adaptor subunit [Enterobacter hormaechei]